MNMQEIEGEAMGAATSAPAVASGGGSMSYAEKVTTALLSGAGTLGVILMGIALRRKREASGVEDAAWVISKQTIERLQAQFDQTQKELDLVRSQRNEFESASIRAEANSRNAADAAALASNMASRNEIELSKLQANWEKAQRYIRILRSTLATAGIDIPPEPQ